MMNWKGFGEFLAMWLMVAFLALGSIGIVWTVSTVVMSIDPLYLYSFLGVTAVIAYVLYLFERGR